MLLFRGDRVRQGSDVIRHVLLGGLLARYGDGGHSDLLRRPGGLVEYVLAHVGWREGTSEEAFARKSILISFSRDRSVAELYMTSMEHADIEQCELRGSDFHLVMLDVQWNELEPTPHEGIRVLRYRRSNANCRGHVLRSRSIIDRAVLELLDEIIREGDSGDHVAGLVDVVTCLERHREEFYTMFPATAEELYPTALSRAKRDQEWLLCPLDPLPGDPVAPSALFHPNQHLSMQGFRRRG